MGNRRRNRFKNTLSERDRRSSTFLPRSSTTRAGSLLSLAFVFVIAAAARLAVASQLSDVPLYRTPQLDGLEYIQWAEQILSGHHVWPSPPPHAPGYPYFLAVLLWLFEGAMQAARSVQALLGGTAAVLTMLVGSRYFDFRVGVLAGILHALYGPLVLVDVSLLSEGVFILLLLLVLVAFDPRRLGTGPVVATGVLLGAASVVRPSGLALWPILVLVLVSAKRPARQTVAHVVGLTLALAITVSPVVYRNWRATGAVLIQGYGGMNFYLGNTPTGDGLAAARLGSDWDELEAEALRQQITNPVEQDQYYFGRALNEISRDPLAYTRLVAAKVVWLLQDEEIRDTHSFYFFASQSPFLSWLPTFGIILPFALLGVAVAAARRNAPPLLAGYLVAFALTCVFLVVGSRYRMPLVPVLLMFAAYGMAAVVVFIRTRHLGRIVVMVALLISGALGSRVWRHEATHNFAEEWALTGDSFQRERSLPAAKEAYRRAIALDPDLAIAWDGLGVALMNEGALPQAQEALLRAVSNEPHHAAALHHLGLVHRRLGNLNEATRLFRQAIGLRPDDAEVKIDLAETLVANGDFEEAAELYEDLLRRVPDEPGFYLALAWAQASRGKLAEAARSARRAVELRPEDAQAWFVLAAVVIEHRPDEAAKVLIQAEERVGQDVPQVRLGWALLYNKKGAYNQADDILRAVLMDHPEFTLASEYLLRNAAQSGKYAEAKRFLEALKPRQP